MTRVLLIYPYFRPSRDRSIFRFPPLGVSYVASSLRRSGAQVSVLDCTFMKRDEALSRARAHRADIVGVYSIVSMEEESFWFAKALRKSTPLLVAGGPLPSTDPLPFLKFFDVAVVGEGEKTMTEVVKAYDEGCDLVSVAGVVCRGGGYRREVGAGGIGDETIPAEVLSAEILPPAKRDLEKDLDSIPFPSRDLLPNEDYIRYGRRHYGYSITTIMTTRGCPFSCEFCSNSVFGTTYRSRSAGNVVDEVEQALGLGYERIHFADDVFTLERERVMGICEEIRKRGIDFEWECLGRVDSLDLDLAREMKAAGCRRIYFGIESSSDRTLAFMRKRITAQGARGAVETARSAGIDVGAFFILFYPGDTNDTVLETLRFAASLPLTYLGLSIPYPIRGTHLYERVKGRMTREWRPVNPVLSYHTLTFDADFSDVKMRFGVLKGQLQFRLRRRFGTRAKLVVKLFEHTTDFLFRLLR